MFAPPSNVAERFDDGAEVFALVAGEGSGHVFPNCESRSNIDTCSPVQFVMVSHLLNDPDRLEKEVAALALMNAELFTGNG